MKKKLRFVLLLFIIILVIGYALGINYTLKVYSLTSSKLESSYEIVHISDLHSSSDTDDILYLVTDKSPDLIVLSGDIFANRENLQLTLEFVETLTTVSEVIFVRGDSEASAYLEIKKELKLLGVTVLEDNYIDINEEIRIIGISDNSYTTLLTNNYENEKRIEQVLESHVDESKYNIVIAHRPHYFDTYKLSSADLVLSGHTEGGKMRIPIVNQGIIVPDQGFFPKYDYGKYESNDTVMIINSGCSNSSIVPRLFNPKEVVIITIN